ncbi:MAG: FkbM family methyltransferase [Pseudomonadota bacterium]
MSFASESRRVLDIGMCGGGDSSLYLHKGFWVVAVEANPVSVEEAETRLKPYIESGQLTIHSVAVSDKDEVIAFHVCDEGEYLSTADLRRRRIWERKGAAFRTIHVPGKKIGDLLPEWEAPYFAKIDIEGYDRVALAQRRQAGVAPRVLSIELDVKHALATLSELAEMGYQRFQLVAQSRVPEQVEPNPAQEGSHSGVDLRKGHSGSFGQDVGGDWVGAAKMRRTLLKRHAEFAVRAMAVNSMRKLTGGKDLVPWVRRLLPRTDDWYDLHARYGG